MDLSTAKTRIQEANLISIVTHKNPDGDAIGSSLGLANLLIKQGINVKVIVPNAYPEFLKWMSGVNDVLDWEKHTVQSDELLAASDVIFCLDFNASHRIGGVANAVLNSGATKIMIDHHLEPEGFCDYILSDTSASSTAELVHQFICELGFQNDIDQNIGEALYCGIMTDTGSFKYPSTSANTHDVVSDLIKKGADNAKVHQLIYDSSSVARLKLIGHCLNEMEIIADKITVFSLSLETHKTLQLKKGDNEGIVNYGLSIKTIQASAFFREDTDIIKISFRSKGDLDMNLFARTYFNGGGHKNAAGGMSKESLENAINHFRTSINEFLGE
ncbi:MAG: phosphoesterase RecJ-like protein [Saprospiraceae bacterium]|jgi:phosphoesterase RecJ-like protein